jgi:hypothetical protein
MRRLPDGDPEGEGDVSVGVDKPSESIDGVMSCDSTKDEASDENDVLRDATCA